MTCCEKECLDGYPCGGGVTSGCEQCQPKNYFIFQYVESNMNIQE